MIKLYFKQTVFQLRENRLISLVSIIGTALAICMIMVIVLVLEVRITDCVPEVNRSRSLYMKAMSIHQKGDTSDNSSNGCMSLTVAKECFKALTVPETVTIVSTGGRMRISVPAGKTMTVDNLETDDTFWNVFSFDFIAGKPFTAADSESGLPKVVISASVARNLFGTVEAVVVLFELANEINKTHNAELAGYLKALGGIIGLLQREPTAFLHGSDVTGGLPTEEIDNLIQQRKQARADNNWAESDRIRDILNAENILLEDGAGGTTWRRG